MTTLESLNELLQEASRTLDAAAQEIRDIPLEPKNENIRAIGDLLVCIFNLQRQIYRLRPELIPTFLWEVREGSDPGPDLIVIGAFRRATAAERSGDVAMAISLLQFLLQTQPSGAHVESASAEIARLSAIQTGG